MGRSREEKTEVIEDFGGGLNTLLAPNRLPANNTPTHSNVWYDDVAVTKKNGQSKISSSGVGDTVFGRVWSGLTLHTSVFSGAQSFIAYVAAGITKNFFLYITAASPTTSTTMLTPTGLGGSGTADTVSASTAVVGHSTNWLTTASPGSLFFIGSTVGIISTVNSDTSLTLTANFGATNTGTSSFGITPSYATSNRCSIVDMNSKAWVCSQGASAFSWDGTSSGVAYVSAFPQTYYSVSYSNYIFAANTSSNPSRVSWSFLKDPTTWPASNFVDVSPNDGFPIVGMFLDGQSIVILKTNSAWLLTGVVFDPSSPTYTLTQIYTPSDFVVNSPKSVQLVNGGYIILGKQGLYKYNGSGTISKALEFDRIRGEFANIAAFSWGTVPAVSAEPASLMVDGSYWLQVPYSSSSISSSDKELTYVLDKNGSIWRWQSTANGMLSDFQYLNGTLYGVNSYSGGTTGLIQLNTGNSDAQTTAINGTITTKVLEFKNQQRFGRANVYFKKQSAGNLTFEYQVDEAGWTSATIDMTTSATFEGGSRVKSNDVLIGSVGRTIQFRLSNNVAAQTFEIYAIEFNRRDLEN